MIQSQHNKVLVHFSQRILLNICAKAMRVAVKNARRGLAKSTASRNQTQARTKVFF